MSPKPSKNKRNSDARKEAFHENFLRILRTPITWFLAICFFLLLACQLSQNEKVQTTISFNKIFDTLS